MATLSFVGAKLMRKYKAHACTDVTGFGIRGHSEALLSCQKNAKLNFKIKTLPIIKDMLKIDKIARDFKLKEGFASETSGGLMICLDEDNAKSFIEEFEKDYQLKAYVIGEVVPGDGKCDIVPDVEIKEVW